MTVSGPASDAMPAQSEADSGVDVAGKCWSRLSAETGLARRVADELAAAIIEGRLASGTRLSEPGIAATFGISRTPVREALYILERDELVERKPRKGAVVAQMTAKQVLDVYVCRAYLYGLSARMCATRLTSNDLATLTDMVATMDSAVSAGDVHAYYRLYLDFHDVVGRASGNEMLLRLGQLTRRYRFMALTLPGQMQSSMSALRELLECLRKQDATRAERVVREMVAAAGDALLAHFFSDDSHPVTATTVEWAEDGN